MSKKGNTKAENPRRLDDLAERFGKTLTPQQDKVFFNVMCARMFDSVNHYAPLPEAGKAALEKCLRFMEREIPKLEKAAK